MDALKANTPEELYQAIGEFLQSDYSHENLVKIYNNSLRCAASFRGIYSDLPVLPEPNREYPLYGLQDIMDWSKEAAKVVDDIASNLEQQTISEVISQLKKLRGVADSVLSLVDTKLKEQAQKEARAKVEKEYANLNEEASKTEGMLLIQRAEVVGKLELKAHAILRQETKDAVQIYLSKDPAFKDRVSQLGNEICEALERLNKLIGSDTSTGKLLDIYCKLKSIPLQRQFDDVGYAYSPIDDWADVICGGCNRLYTSIDNVIKTFEEIQTKARSEQEKRVTYTGEEAWQKMWEKFLEYGRYTIPEKPFTDKPIKITDNNYSPGEGYRELLTEVERKVLTKAVPELSDAGIEAVLRRVYNMGDEHIKNLTWKQIFAFCKDHINSQMPKNSGDTYNINAEHVSLGEKAQHAGRDINKSTPEPEKENKPWNKKIWPRVTGAIIFFAAIATILGVVIDFVRKPKNNELSVGQIETLNVPDDLVDVNGVVFEARPMADEIIEEIERLPVFEQKVAAENYIGRTFKWRLRFEFLVHEEGGMVYVACKASPVRGKVSFNINADVKENLKIKKIKKGKFLDVSGEIMGISLDREPQIRLKDVRLEFVD